MTIQLGVLLLYSAVLIGVGLWIGRRVGASEFFVADRRLSASLLFSTVLAANIGAGSTVGAAALAYQEGLSAWWWNGSSGIGSLFLAFWIGPRIWREASRHGFFTVGDFLEHHYGSTVRGLVAALLWLGTVAILAAQLIGVGTILAALAGVPITVGCMAGGLITVVYFAAGGLLGSAWVNVIQLAVLLVGFALAAPLALASVGGVHAFTTTPDLQPGFLEFWHVSGPGSGWTRLALMGPAFFLSPGLLQKAYGAESERAVRLGIGANAIALMLFAFLPVILGMAARLTYPNLDDPQLALPMLLAGMPLAIGSIGLAAVFSAEISTCDAILFMLATSLSQDLYRRFVNPAATEGQVLKVARYAALAGGVLAVLVAINSRSIIQTMSIFFGLLVVSLFVPIVLGLHRPSTTTREVMTAIVAGVVTTTAVYVWSGGGGIGMLTPDNAGMIAALGGFCIVWLVGRATQRASG